MHKPSPAERYILSSIELVGEMPDDARLADATDLLVRAKALVADFVEEARLSK